MTDKQDKAALEEQLRKGGSDENLDTLDQLARLYEEEGASSWGGDRRSETSGPPTGKDGRSAVARLAGLTGESERAMRRKLRIARQGTPKLKAALAAGRISQNLAAQIVSLSGSQQDEHVDHLVSATSHSDAGRSESVAMTEADIRRRIEEDPDFVNVESVDYSLKKLEEKYPEGIPEEIIAEAMMLSGDDVDARMAEIAKEMATLMKVRSD